MLCLGLGQNPPQCLASIFGAPPGSQTDEESYYKNAYTIIDLPLAELLADYPELQGLQPAGSQQDLPTILSKVGTTVERLYQDLPSVAADEQITQQQYGYDGRVKSTTRHAFAYLIIVNRDQPVPALQEYRTDDRGKPVESTGVSQGFDSTTNFASMWVLLYPDNQSETNFRYVGQQTSGGRNLYVVAFAERPGEAAVKGLVDAGGRSAVLLYQGLAWIDAASYRIVKMRLDLLEPRLDVALERSTTEIQFGEFRIPQAVVWLPREVTVTTIYNGQMYRNRHVYSNFKRFVVHSEIKPVEEPKPHPPD